MELHVSITCEQCVINQIPLNCYIAACDIHNAIVPSVSTPTIETEVVPETVFGFHCRGKSCFCFCNKLCKVCRCNGNFCVGSDVADDVIVAVKVYGCTVVCGYVVNAIAVFYGDFECYVCAVKTDCWKSFCNVKAFTCNSDFVFNVNSRRRMYFDSNGNIFRDIGECPNIAFVGDCDIGIITSYIIDCPIGICSDCKDTLLPSSTCLL